MHLQRSKYFFKSYIILYIYILILYLQHAKTSLTLNFKLLTKTIKSKNYLKKLKKKLSTIQKRESKMTSAFCHVCITNSMP